MKTIVERARSGTRHVAGLHAVLGVLWGTTPRPPRAPRVLIDRFDGRGAVPL
jgi:hypothetical protein